MGEDSDVAPNPDVYVIPFPAQGHINPALAFAKCLASNNLRITFIITTKISRTATFSPFPSITIATISDGSEDLNGPDSPEAFFKRFNAAVSRNLEKFIDEQKRRPKLIIYDSVMPWVLDIAHRRGLLGASFFTQSPAVSSVFYHVKEGSLRYPLQEDTTVSLPSLPELRKEDLPCFHHIVGSEKPAVELLAGQFSNIEEADWIFFNTFDKLETQILEWMASRWPIKTVGPTFSLLQQDEQFSDSKNHSISLFEPNHDTCRTWLDSRKEGSVVYVSFGSIASLGKQQMEELAFGLIMSDCHFLWVVRSSEVDKLPQDFTTLASEKGLIVAWCHQPDALAHPALACFMSHCGWNSTLEALSRGVPLIAMSQWVDQKTNSKFIEDVWGIGVGVKAGEDGIIGREEIAQCIKEVVHGDKGIELKINSCKWKDMANEAVQKGGSSANNIQDFVSTIKSNPA